MKRYLSAAIEADLAKKMVFLSGPRQSGKTTLAKTLIFEKGGYLNYDIAADRRRIRNGEIDESFSRIALDELHKMPKWKNYLKGLYDGRRGEQSYLITGSARLEIFQRQGDALTGRYYSYHLHPVCPAEAVWSERRLSPREATERVLRSGGFPEAYLNPKDAERLREGRFEAVIHEDLRDLSRVLSLRQFETLIEILRERGSGQISYSGLAEDLSVSTPTVMKWVAWLERLYVVFLVYPWSSATARSLKKEPKFYFYDCAANYERGARLENLVACALVKHLDFLRDTSGRKLELRYFKDKEKREVDFVVLEHKRPLYLIEVKQADVNLASSLCFLRERYPHARAIQLVHEMNGAPMKIKGCEITEAGDWMASELLRIVPQ